MADGFLLYTVQEACRIGGFGTTRCYELIATGALDARKAGRRTVITGESLRRYVDALPKVALRRALPRAA